MTVIPQARRGSVHGVDVTRMEIHPCAECGVLYGMPKSFLDQRRKDGGTFYCPNGHSLSYNETDLDRERKRRKRAEEDARWEADRAARARADADQAKASARAEKAAKTRIRNSRERERQRVANGVCPCCKRSFRDLRRHMASQHPDHAQHGQPS